MRDPLAGLPGGLRSEEPYDMYEGLPSEISHEVTLYTDALAITGTIRTRKRRLSDVLNETEALTLPIEDATFRELGGGTVERSAFAYVSLEALLFAVSRQRFPASPQFHVVKVTEQALLSLPPFRVVGRIHLHPGIALRDALAVLPNRFLAVTEATYWSELLDEPRAEVPMVAVNQRRAQVLAAYDGPELWSGGTDEDPATTDDAGTDDASLKSAEPASDPWRDLPAG